MNIRIGKKPIASFLDGKYSDFIPEWYLDIGTTLVRGVIFVILIRKIHPERIISTLNYQIMNFNNY